MVSEGEHGAGTHLTREQLVDRIQLLNPTACPDYLSRFDRGALRSYLDHLDYSLRPRGREACWVRPGDTPAIMYAEADEG